MKVDANGSFRLSDSKLNQLIEEIENGGDRFRVSLTDAFFQQPYDRTRSEGKMNDALRGFKKAADQVRIRFDARELISDDVKHLLDQAEPLDNFMRDNKLTERSRSDWSTLRANLSILANAYDVAPSWISNSSSQTGYKGTNRLTGTFKLAIIGAIAGGGKGAAIGGIIGAAGGAGTVFIQGKDILELPAGSELTIRASGPR
jgi:hypothetical protein